MIILTSNECIDTRLEEVTILFLDEQEKNEVIKSFIEYNGFASKPQKQETS